MTLSEIAKLTLGFDQAKIVAQLLGTLADELRHKCTITEIQLGGSKPNYLAGVAVSCIMLIVIVALVLACVAAKTFHIDFIEHNTKQTVIHFL